MSLYFIPVRSRALEESELETYRVPKIESTVDIENIRTPSLLVGTLKIYSGSKLSNISRKFCKMHWLPAIRMSPINKLAIVYISRALSWDRVIRCVTANRNTAWRKNTNVPKESAVGCCRCAGLYEPERPGLSLEAS